MVSQKITITNPSGLHARPAGELAKICSKCNSEVVIKVGDRSINPKSILVLMSAAIRCGTEIEVECSGLTEEEDMELIIEEIASVLGE